MSYAFYQKRKEVFEGTSGASSTYTSQPHFIGDFGQMSISWTSSGATSTLTLQMTNEDGFRSSLVTWSNVTGLTLQGMYAVETGGRWMRCLRTSVDSLGEVYFQART